MGRPSNEYIRRRKNGFKERGFCPHCEKSKAEPGHVLCTACMAKSRAGYHRRETIARASQKAHREELQRQGICVDCRNTQAAKGRTLCQICLEKRRKRYHTNVAMRDTFIEENTTSVEQKMAIAERLYRLRRYAA